MNSQVLLPIIAGVFIGAILFFVFFRLIIRGKYMAQTEKPLFDEKAAETLLKKQGYRVLAKRLRETVVTKINDKEHFGYIQADYLVDKLKKRYPVLVYAGEGSPDPNEENFRRRLIEIDRAFHVDGVLCLDLNKMEIYCTGFRFPKERDLDFFFRFLGALFIISIVIGIIWLLVHSGLL